MSTVVNPISVFELGEMYKSNNSTATEISTIDAWVTDENILEGVTRMLEYHDDAGDTYLKVPTGTNGHAGYYWITWTVSADGTQGDRYEFGIDINGTVAPKTIAQAEQGVGGSTNMSGTAIISLTGGDEIRGAIRNLDSTGNITVIHSNISVVRI